MPSPETPKRGRPTKYKAEYARLAKKLCERGATDAELAEVLGVTTMTIWRWQCEHEEFCYALKAGKEVADDRVERSLYQRAVGYSYNSEKMFSWQGSVTRVPCIEHVPPDPGAAMNWLTNRRPDRWRSKQSLEHTGKDGKDLMPEASPRDIARAIMDLFRTLSLEGHLQQDEMEPAGSSPSPAAPTARARAQTGCASASTGAASEPDDRPGNPTPRLSPKRKTITRKSKR